MMFHIIVNTLTDRSKTYDLVMEDDNGNRIVMPCRSRNDAYQLGATLAGSIEVSTTLLVEYL